MTLRFPRLHPMKYALRASLSGYKLPRAVTLVDEIPRNATGKAQYPRAKELAMAARAFQDSSISSCSGENARAPSTPIPPARLTAAATSRQWVNAKIGNSMPSISHSSDFTCPPG